MANTRPFTYNDNTPINGTLKNGDLSYGYLNDTNGGEDYSGNPGGKKWWMGPDEDNRYIIAKDVPTMDWPTSTPEGNIGSVRFWGTGSNDSNFINLTNKIAGTSFTTTQESYSWVLNNGYWTNYPYKGSGTSLLWNELNVRNQDNIVINQTVFYNSQSNSVIAGYGNVTNNSGVKGPYHITSSEFTTGSTLNKNYGSTGDILPGEAKYESIQSSGKYITLDYNNNKLFTTFGSENDGMYLVKYNLTTETVENEVLLTSGKFSESYHNNQIIYDSYNSRLYLPYTDYTTTPSTNEIYVYNSTNLNLIDNTSNTLTDKGWPQLSSNPNNGELLQLNSSIFPNRFTWWNFDNISSPTYEYYRPTINWRLTSPLQPSYATNYSPLTQEFPFSPVQNKFYITGFQTGSSYPSLNGNGNALLVLDGSTHEAEDIIYLGGDGFGTNRYMLYTVGVYDELRDYVWTFNLDDKLVVINCATNKIVGEFVLDGFKNNEGIFGLNWYYIPSLALDNVNNRLYYATGGGSSLPIQSFDLTNIISQLPS